MKNLDGSEFDLQISKDSTVWVFHDHEILNQKNSVKNFSSLTNSELEQISSLNFNGKLIKFHDLLKKLTDHKIKDKILCLDLKALLNDVTIQHFGGEVKIAEFFKNYLKQEKALLNNFKLILEVPHLSQYLFFKRNSNFEIYLVVSNSFDFYRYRENNLNLSFSINNEINSILKETLSNKSVWVMNTFSDFLRACSTSPSIIQTDHINFGKFLLQRKNKSIYSELNKTIFSVKSRNEFYDLHLFNIKSRKNFMIKIDVEGNFSKNRFLLVFSSINRKNEVLFWNSYPIDKKNQTIYQFIDVEFLKQYDCEQVKIYLWNQQKSSLKIKKIKVQHFF